MQGDVAVAWVKWEDDAMSTNPSAELVENLQRVSGSN
jgi:hypothetical protein